MRSTHRALIGGLLAAVLGGVIWMQARQSPVENAAEAIARRASSTHAARPRRGTPAAGQRDAATVAAALKLTQAEQRQVDAWHTARRAAVRAYLRRAIQATDAQSQLDVAFLLDLPMDAQTPEEFARSRAARNRAIGAAARADPQDPLAAWLEAVFCSDPAVCDAAGARHRLQALFPGDVQVWLLDPAQAGPGAGQALDALLQRAARGTTFVDRFDLIAARADEALQRAGWPAPSPDARDALVRSWGFNGPISTPALRRGDAISMATATAFPSLSAVTTGCRPPQGAARAAACRTVMARMADAGTVLHEAIATRRMVELTAGTAQHAYWLERYRQQMWRRSYFGQLLFNPRLLELRLQMSEIDALDVLAELEGRPVAPPPGWQPRG